MSHLAVSDETYVKFRFSAEIVSLLNEVAERMNQLLLAEVQFDNIHQ